MAYNNPDMTYSVRVQGLADGRWRTCDYCGSKAAAFKAAREATRVANQNAAIFKGKKMIDGPFAPVVHCPHDVTPDDVISVYSGKAGTCCCGCAGTHYYNPTEHLVREGSKRRGYPVAPEETSSRMIKRVLGILQKAAPQDVRVHDGVDTAFFCTVVGERLYVVYLRPHIRAVGEE